MALLKKDKWPPYIYVCVDIHVSKIFERKIMNIFLFIDKPCRLGVAGSIPGFSQSVE